MNPSELMRADEAERALFTAAAERAYHYRQLFDRNLAVMIVNQWVEVQKRSRRR